MILPSRRKHRITVRSTDSTVVRIVRGNRVPCDFYTRSIPLSLLPIAACLCLTGIMLDDHGVQAQSVQAQTATWTNREAWNRQHPAGDEVVAETSSQRRTLPWRRPAGQATQPVPLSSYDASSRPASMDSVSADTEDLISEYQLSDRDDLQRWQAQTDPSADHAQSLRQAALINLPRRAGAAPPTDSFRNPFGDSRHESTQQDPGFDVFGDSNHPLMSPASGDPFHDPFGETLQHRAPNRSYVTQASADEAPATTSPALIQLPPHARPASTPSPTNLRPTPELTGYQTARTTPSPSLQLVGVELNSPGKTRRPRRADSGSTSHHRRVAKPRVRQASQNEPQPQVQSEVQSEVQPQVQAHLQPHVRSEVQPQVKAHVQPLVQSHVQRQVQPQVQRHVQLAGLPKPSLTPAPLAPPVSQSRERDPVQEFPGFDTKPIEPSIPPSPDDVPGNRWQVDPDLQNRDLQLPDVAEPPRPAGDDMDIDVAEPPRVEGESDDDEIRMPNSRPFDDSSMDGESTQDDDSTDAPLHDEALDDERVEQRLESDIEQQEADEDEREPKCGRIYIDRDCCKTEERCRMAWDKMGEMGIDHIAVDISPPIVPLPEGEEDIEDQREELKKSPSRDWRDKNGSLLVTGKLEDLVNQRVVIRMADGNTRVIPFDVLGFDEQCFVAAWWDFPAECAIPSEEYVIRDWTMMTFTWKASGACHKTPFFEDVQLERYGHSAGPFLQPLLSGAHFFANVALMPYNAGVYPPNECHYVLGHYRPGSCAPWLVPAFPLSRRGVAFEALGALGFIGLF